MGDNEAEQMKLFTERFETTKSTLQNTQSPNNRVKRQLHAKLEMLKLDIEEYNEKLSARKLKPDNKVADLVEDIVKLQKLLSLTQIRYRRTALSLLDEIVRLLAIWMMLVTGAVFLVIPCLLCMPLEGLIATYILRLKSRYHIAAYIKVFISDYVLTVAGISTWIRYEVDQKETFKERSIVCFTHGSTIDAFLITASIKTNNYTLAKDDLFLIPFFNIMLLAFNGIPVVRSNLEKAKESLHYVQETLQEGECISISPEGTRTKTGQLSEFKKGAFHMWEHLQVPIVPMMIFGAYELFPPGSQLCVPGNVVVQFLKPIQPSEAKSRHEMSILLRRRMCEAIAKCPEEALTSLTGTQRIKNQRAILTLFAFDYAWWRFMRDIVVDRYGVSWYSIGYFCLAFMFGSMFAVYGYMVYVQPAIARLFRKNKAKKSI